MKVKELKWYHRLYNLFAGPVWILLYVLELFFIPTFYVIFGDDWNEKLDNFNRRILFERKESPYYY